MKIKSILTLSLLTLVVVSLVYLIIDDSTKNVEPSQRGELNTAVANQDTDSALPVMQTDKIIAYYFHRTARCVSCQTIESYTHEVIHTKFSDELKSGVLDWVTVNVEEEKNEHFIQDYQLISQSVVLVELKEGKHTRWKNLQNVWEYLDAKEVFVKYIEDEVESFMKTGT